MQPAIDLARPVQAGVLLVDDVAANLVALEAILEPLGCQLIRATSGHEALRQILFHDFAVVLMDVMMPDLDGLTTAALIKNRPAQRHVPIMFLTARDDDPKAVARGYALGAVDFLSKPLDPDVLRAKVAVFVELFLRGQELKQQTELAQQRERELLENRRLYESERGARAHAETIARAREEIIAVVSHDLRNPMTAIAANAEIIRRKLAQGIADGVAARVEAIQRGIERMEALVHDLFDTASIQSGNLAVNLQVEEVAGIVNQVADLLGSVLASANQMLEVTLPERPLRARCDRERIFQVLSNLVGNAGKFSPEGSSISIRVIARPREVVFEILDRGSGISSEQLPHIFEPYWRASRTRRPGLGLGLAIAKGIVEAHDGRIWVESRPGDGSKFAFSLPAAD
jgi:signal transduction histidine kinase